MEKQQFDELVAKLGAEAAKEIQKISEAVEQKLIKLAEERTSGKLSTEDFEKFKTESIAEVNEKLGKLEEIAKAQGEKMNTFIGQTQAAQPKSIEQILLERKDEIKAIKEKGVGSFEIALKVPGVQTVGGNIAAMDAPPNSPYAPGIDGGILELFDIRKNPNFIMNYVDRGRTDRYRLAWLNELATGEGVPTKVTEGNAKPLIDKDFKVEISTAEKIAGMVKMTEEWVDDLPGLATQVRRMLYDDVVRAFDDAVYTSVIAAAPAFTLTSFDDKVKFPNYWDAIRVGIAQISKNNYTTNFIGVNPTTLALMEMAKNENGTYTVPPFNQSITSKLHEANKVAEGYALMGDITQYKVDIYKDFTMRVGWNNDDFQRNQFSVVCEVRYHDYISDNRKKALAYYNLDTVLAQIEKPIPEAE